MNTSVAACPTEKGSKIKVNKDFLFFSLFFFLKIALVKKIPAFPLELH